MVYRTVHKPREHGSFDHKNGRKRGFSRIFRRIDGWRCTPHTYKTTHRMRSEENRSVYVEVLPFGTRVSAFSSSLALGTATDVRLSGIGAFHVGLVAAGGKSMRNLYDTAS
jgi:hypothetical protein